MSVLDKLNESKLDDVQKQRVLNALAAVRENHVSFRTDDGKIDPDQKKTGSIHKVSLGGSLIRRV